MFIVGVTIICTSTRLDSCVVIVDGARWAGTRAVFFHEFYTMVDVRGRMHDILNQPRLWVLLHSLCGIEHVAQTRSLTPVRYRLKTACF